MVFNLIKKRHSDAKVLYESSGLHKNQNSTKLNRN